MKYIIQTKQKNYLNGLTHKKIEDVIDAVFFYDLLPPFKVLDETNNDVTDIILQKLKDIGYKFVDKKEVASLIPLDLQKLMNKYYNKFIEIDSLNKLSIKLTTIKDIKSIKGFYEIWDKKGITIGSNTDFIYFYDTEENNICAISVNSLKDLDKKKFVIAPVSDFVTGFQSRII